MIRDFSSSEFLFLLRSTQWTIVLSLIAFVGGGVLGFFIAVLRTAPAAPLRWLTSGYIQLFQGTPLLMQLFLVYFGLGLFGLRLDPWTAVTIGFTVYAGAFLGDIWRGCIEAVPRTQWEAGRALALSYPLILWFVILPQALRIAVPPLVNTFVGFFKDTSLVLIIGLFDLLSTIKVALTEPAWNGFGVEAYLFAALVYFVFCFAMSRYSRRFEHRAPETLTLREPA
jgi:polar amino acid transport system permease protein